MTAISEHLTTIRVLIASARDQPERGTADLAEAEARLWLLDISLRLHERSAA